MNLNNKTILLTGASGGIGSVLAEKLAKEKANLLLVGRKFKKKNLELPHIYIEADLTTKEGISQLRNTLKNYSVDVLVNMAGVGIYKSFEDYTPDDFYYSLQVNLMLPFSITKIVLDDLKKSDIGLVLNIGSGAGVMPFKNRTGYCASKYGLRGLSSSLSEEYEGRKPYFCLITLGSTMTTFGGKSIEEQERQVREGSAIFPPEYVANELVKIIKDESRKSEIILFPSEHGFGEWKKPS